MNFRIRKKIAYLFKSRHRKGHGIHSPFLFRLITTVIENKGSFTAYPLLKAASDNVGSMLKILDMKDYLQLPDKSFRSSMRTVKNLHLLPCRFDRLLFRLVNEFRPDGIAYCGSTFGVTLMALALADKRIRLMASVENDHYRTFCRRLVEVYEQENIVLVEEGITEAADFTVIQFPLDPCQCERMVTKVMDQPVCDRVVVLCGIHASSEMEAVWENCKSYEAVRLSLDLFELGICICRKGLQKEDFVLRF